MSDNPVKWTAAGLTPAGNALQAALLGTGDGLTFTRAAAADAEGVERLDLTLQSPCTVDGPKCRVPVLLTNAGVDTAFTMTELRFYVRRVTDGAPTGEEILYATVTDETGDPIPTAAQSPGFTIDWAFVFQYGNAGSVTVTLDPVGLVSIGMVGRPGGVAALGDNGAVPVSQGGTGATTAPAALTALGAGVRPNLLDNAYFVGGGTGYGTFPVNQKGVLSGNTDRQFICDRWGQFGSEWRLTKDGLIMAKRSDAAYWSFYQQIPVETLHQLVGKVVTVSVLLDSVLVTATQVLVSPVTYFPFENGERAEIYVPDDAVGSVQYYGSTTTRTVKALKFEMGAGQTLAYQDADGAWHLLPQPDSDYVTQLLRCQQYLFDCGNALEDFPATMNGTWGSATVQIPIPMVKTPVLSKKSSGYGVIYTSTGALAVTNATVHYLDGNHAIILLQTESSVVSNCVWRECAFWLDTGM